MEALLGLAEIHPSVIARCWWALMRISLIVYKTILWFDLPGGPRCVRCTQ